MTYQKSDYEVTSIRDLIIPKFWDTYNTKTMHKIYTSGRAGTKSSRGSIKAVNTIVEDEDGSVVILRKFHNKLSKTVYKEVLRAITRLGYDKSEFKITKSPMQVTYLENGNTIYFTGNDSLDDTKGMIDEDKPIKLVIIDEVNEFFEKGDGEDELVNIMATFVRGNNESFVMEYYFNPPKNIKAPVMQWVAKMKKRSDCIHIHNDYRDVPVEWLGKKLIDEAEAMKKADEKMYRWLWLGESIGLDDLIYYMFSDSHIKKHESFNDLKFIGIGVDYGQMNATTFQAFGLNFNEQKLVGIGEFYHSGRDTGHQKSPSDYAQEFKKFVEQIEQKTNSKVVYCVIDPSAKGLKEEIKRVCPQINYVDANNSVLKGINRVQKLLAFNILELDDSQKNAIDEFEQYAWDEESAEKGLEKPIKMNDHCMDAIRYLVMMFWKWLKLMLPVSERGDD